MRISDWSSDVCSSDLLWSRAGPAGDAARPPPLPPVAPRAAQLRSAGDDPRLGEQRRLVVEGPARDRHRPLQLRLLIGFGAAHHLGRLRREPRHRRDRKLVVEGKSVSVRVDLGGSRIIKQTKHKNYNNTHILITNK